MIPELLRLVAAEWTKLRSVRGWLVATAATALLIVLFPVAGLGGGPPDQRAPIPLGPESGPVVDAYFFVHRPLSGDGRITVDVRSLTSPGGAAAGPWAKAGLLVSAGPAPGSRYAAVMVTGGHGVRMQHDYVHDRAGAVPGATFLRLTRSGDTVTGEVSPDGTAWRRIDRVRLAGLATTVEVGLFVAGPQRAQGLGTVPDEATARFGRPRLEGSWAGGWTGGQRGAGTATFSGYPQGRSGGFAPAGDGFTVTGAGDLAPATRADLPLGVAAGDLLLGTFPALVVAVVLATLMVTTEYESGLIRGTLGAGPRRRRVLAAKALVTGTVTFVAGLAGAVVALPLWLSYVRGHGVYVFPVTAGDLLRAEVGTAAVLALGALLALGAGTVLRRGAPAVSTVVAVTVVPYLLALVPFLPPSLGRWLTRVTPAAGLAVQQTLVRYPQVETLDSPAAGYFPLPAWAGLLVLCGWTALALAGAAVALRRRDV